ncbi:hypothetical protein KHQ06_33320 [Nocardia tengchongensis]|uniref:Uncharacterized protein n=1 Tax=Nocardia tengchongensis TaxID=2055889 RepID=A0ABX8CMV6_9NOCA|nr:hypothetical protein [Nocardia tengchongensis]QVI20909.1 hypothetical protein KHQ06_33320 [Nocardia tengchongensis]
MTTTSAQDPSSQTRRRQIPLWDKVVTGVCLAVAVVVAIVLALATAVLSTAADRCKPGSSCMDQVDHGIHVSLLGTAAILVIGLSCVIIARITRTWLFIWAVATLVLLPVPSVIGSNIVKHASELSTVGPSRP